MATSMYQRHLDLPAQIHADTAEGISPERLSRCTPRRVILATQNYGTPEGEVVHHAIRLTNEV
jgi:hypothetical protein